MEITSYPATNLRLDPLAFALHLLQVELHAEAVDERPDERALVEQVHALAV